MVRGGPFMDAEQAFRMLKPKPNTNDPKDESHETLYVSVNIENLLKTRRAPQTFTYVAELFGTEVILRIEYYWIDTGNGVSPVHQWLPYIVGVWWENINLVKNLREHIRESIFQECLSHHAAQNT
jgi:hypothetical protein